MKTLVVWVVLAAAPLVGAAEEDWGSRLAGWFSGRLDEIHIEVVEVEASMVGLPRVPIDDQGGSGGFASLHPSEFPTGADAHAVELRWGEVVPIDEVALIPARRYDAQGLEAQFGMPDSFQAFALNGTEEVLLGEVSGLWSDPVLAGHPIFLKQDSVVFADGIKIRAGRLPSDPYEGSSFVHAWAECMVFSEGRNVAGSAEVKALSGMAPSAPWQWSAEFLVDGQTPLGLPEVEDENHVNVGWLSKAMPTADSTVTLEIDLEEVAEVDALRLFPAKRPTPDLPSGFGFPERLEVSFGATQAEVNQATPQVFELRNPGHNPVRLPVASTSARFVRLRATRLWKPFDTYPAFCAFSEIEVLNGMKNVALGGRIRSADGMGNVVAPGGRYWSSQSLTDGFGPDGRIVPMAEWLGMLDQRRQLETRLVELRHEAEMIVAGWRRTALWAVVLVSAAGAILLIVLPIRFKIREKRKLVEVRERIAGDLHDEVGSNLGSIQMFADLAEGRMGVSDELKRIQRIAAETVSAVRDIVWLLRPGRAHRIGTVEHLRETASIMLEPLQWHFTADEPAWEIELSDEANRHLFLYFREALHNILRHAKATEVWIAVTAKGKELRLVIRDDGVGIPPEKRERPATLRALRQRAESLAGSFDFEPGEEGGTRLSLSLPVSREKKAGPG